MLDDDTYCFTRQNETVKALKVQAPASRIDPLTTYVPTGTVQVSVEYVYVNTKIAVCFSVGCVCSLVVLMIYCNCNFAGNINEHETSSGCYR